MDSYLVRIYRKTEDNPRMLIGVVEEVGKKEKKAFNTLNELWDILNRRRELKKRKTSENGGKEKGQRVNAFSPHPPPSPIHHNIPSPLGGEGKGEGDTITDTKTMARGETIT